MKCLPRFVVFIEVISFSSFAYLPKVFSWLSQLILCVFRKDNKVDVSQFAYEDATTGNLPTLTIYGTNLNDVDLAETDDEEEEEEVTEEKNHAVTFKVDGKELPIQLSGDEIKAIFSDCEFDEIDMLDGGVALDVKKDGKMILQHLIYDEADMNGYYIEDAQSVDFMIEIEDFETITKDMTKDELLTSYDGYIKDEGNIVFLTGYNSTFDGVITLWFDDNGNLVSISL